MRSLLAEGPDELAPAALELSLDLTVDLEVSCLADSHGVGVTVKQPEASLPDDDGVKVPHDVPLG